MPTKAELEAEVAALRAQLEERDEDTTPDDVDSEAETEDATPEDSGSGSGTGSPALDGILRDHGLAGSDLEALFEQLSEELGDLPQRKPVLTALGAFALGFVVGRMSKQGA